MASFSITLNDP